MINWVKHTAWSDKGGIYADINKFIHIEISENPIKVTLNRRLEYKKEFNNFEDAKKAALRILKEKLLATMVEIEERI